MMSSILDCPAWARLGCRIVVVSTVLIGLSGCYTRQIEGIQSDLDNLDRKLHSLNLKEKSSSSAVSKKTILRLEDQLNQVTLQQADLKDDLAALRQDFSEFKSEISMAGPTTAGPRSVDNSEIRRLAADMAKNEQKTDELAKKVSSLQKTFEGLRTETKSLISLLKEELGAEDVASQGELPAIPPESNSLTKVESPLSTGLVDPLEPPTAGIQAEREYRVNPGENLTTIAKKFGVKIDELRKINDISDPNTLKVGQVIYIP